MTTFGGDISGI